MIVEQNTADSFIFTLASTEQLFLSCKSSNVNKMQLGQCEMCVRVADLLPGVPHVVQLHHPGEDGAMAVSAGVDRHLLHHHSGTGEGPTGKPSRC